MKTKRISLFSFLFYIHKSRYSIYCEYCKKNNFYHSKFKKCTTWVINMENECRYSEILLLFPVNKYSILFIIFLFLPIKYVRLRDEFNIFRAINYYRYRKPLINVSEVFAPFFCSCHFNLIHYRV